MKTHHGGRRPLPDWEAYLVVFGASLCTLVLELVAARVLAPAIGSSLFTWTSVIGMVLAGLAIGNYAGGAAAHRWASPAALGSTLLAAAAYAWTAALLVRVVSLEHALTGLEPLTRVVTLTGLLLFPPSALLGAVTPLVAQLILRQRAEAGAVVGRLGAMAAGGSIAGTFLTGFVLIPMFGSRAILGAVAIALLGLAALVAFGRVRLPRAEAPAALVALAGGAALMGMASGFALTRDANACLRETPYYCVRLDWHVAGEIRYAQVRLDRTTHGYTAPEAPRLMVAPYTQALADVAVSHLERLGFGGTVPDRGSLPPGRQAPQEPLRALFIGGGSYTLPQYLASVFPGSVIDVLEIDPNVTAVARHYLGLALRGGGGDGEGERGAIRVSHGDARLTLRELPESTYHLVVGDAFSDMAVPWHLTTVEFDRDVRRVMRSDGIYAVNIIDAWPRGRFLAAYTRTMQLVFPYVAVVDVQAGGGEGFLANWLVVGAQLPVDAGRIERSTRPGVAGPDPARARFIEPPQVAQWLATYHPRVPPLTDDYAPVDYYLAWRLVG